MTRDHFAALMERMGISQVTFRERVRDLSGKEITASQTSHWLRTGRADPCALALLSVMFYLPPAELEKITAQAQAELLNNNFDGA